MGLADGATEVHQITLARELLKGYTPTPDLFPTRHLPKLKAEAEARFADVLASAGRSLSSGTLMVSTVVDIIRTQADLDTPALVFEDREISYRTLHARSSQVGAGDARRWRDRRPPRRIPRQEPP